MRSNSTFRSLQKRLSTNSPGLTVAIVALIFALTGGAFAAGGGLTSKQKKQVKAIAQTEAKKAAGQGPVGPQGPAGAKGDIGAEGKAGKEGKEGKEGEKGEEGKAGKEGTSVTNTVEPKGANCAEGGSKFVGTSTTFACNGSEGPKGEPWTPNNFLPPGATEMGSWAFAGSAADTNGIRVPLSFFIPISVILEAGEVHFAEDEDFADFCKGGALLPKPEPGHLCVYVNGQESIENTSLLSISRIDAAAGAFGNEAGPTGAMLLFAAPTGNAVGSGSYAVRAPLAGP
jgi:hypothetical protein